MHLILVGCEWAGKRTLGFEIDRWWAEQTGREFHAPPAISFHDHFTLPHVVHQVGHESHKELSEREILTLNPGLLEHFQRFQTDYHFGRGFVNNPDHWLIDWYYGDAVYGPHYWGYGGADEYGDRRMLMKHYDEEVMEVMPSAILVLVKASPEAIRHRMKEGKSLYPERHANTPFKSDDAELVLGRFQEEFDDSVIRQRFSIDTTDATVEESTKEFIGKVEPYLTDEDRKRIAERSG